MDLFLKKYPLQPNQILLMTQIHIPVKNLMNSSGIITRCLVHAYSTKDNQSFYNYYNDISKKVKERKIDHTVGCEYVSDRI